MIPLLATRRKSLTPSRPRKRRGHRPSLEPLEGRALLSGAGSLDPTFGTGGRVITSFTTGNDLARPMFMQPDGRIVTAGQSYPSSWDLARYNTNGALDASFGSGGKVTTPLRGYLSAATPYPDSGHPSAPLVLAAGWVNVPNGKQYQSDFQLIRYNNDGSLDTSFGGTGEVTAGSGSGNDFLAGVAVQPDGKIVAGGDSFSTPGGYDEAALLRYNPDGTLDTSFGNSGEVLTIYRPTNPGAGSAIEDLALQPDGKIVTVGESGTSVSPATWVTVARYNLDGTIDTSFGSAGTGLVVISQSSGSVGRSVSLQPDGKIVVAGQWTVGSTSEFTLARLNPDGTPDSTFGTGGITGIPQGRRPTAWPCRRPEGPSPGSSQRGSSHFPKASLSASTPRATSTIASAPVES